MPRCSGDGRSWASATEKSQRLGSARTPGQGIATARRSPLRLNGGLQRGKTSPRGGLGLDTMLLAAVFCPRPRSPEPSANDPVSQDAVSENRDMCTGSRRLQEILDALQHYEPPRLGVPSHRLGKKACCQSRDVQSGLEVAAGEGDAQASVRPTSVWIATTVAWPCLPESSGFLL